MDEPKILMTKTFELASDIHNRFSRAREQKQLQEAIWIAAMRNFNGEYDSSIEFREGGSSVFVNITQMKTMAAYSRVMAIMMGASGFPWNVKPTPHPALVKMGLTPDAAVASELDPAFKQEVSEAKSACDGMRNRIKDDLVESYWEEKFARGVLEMATLGTMAFKGPIAAPPRPKKWIKVEQNISVLDRIKGALGMAKVEAERYTLSNDPMDEYRATMDWVSVFSLYPDPGAYEATDLMWMIERHVMNKAQFVELAGGKGFDPEEMKAVLEQYPDGNWSAESWESYMDSINKRNATSSQMDRYTVLEFWGYLSGKEIIDAGGKAKDENAMYMANIWVCGNNCIKVSVSSNLSQKIPYYLVPYEKVPYKIWGRGVPEKMADPQAIINASARAMVENMGMCAGPQLIVDTKRIAPGTDYSKITPWGIWPVINVEGISEPPIRFQKIDPVLSELKLIQDIFRNFVQEVTSMPDMASGFVGNGEHNRTMGGMSMLFGAADSYTRSVVFNVDNHLTKPMIRGLYDWNMQYCPDPTIKGDMVIEASGVQGLMAKELTSQRLAELLQAVGQIPGGSDYINMPELMKEIFRSLDVINDSVILSEMEVSKKRQEQQQAEIAMTAQKAQAENVPKPKTETTLNDALLQALKESEPTEAVRPMLYAKVLNAYGELDPMTLAALNMMKDRVVAENRMFANQAEISAMMQDLDLSEKIGGAINGMSVQPGSQSMNRDQVVAPEQNLAPGSPIAEQIPTIEQGG